MQKFRASPQMGMFIDELVIDNFAGGGGASTGIEQAIDEPVQTITTKHRFGLVTVAGEQYEIADIGMRMLEPHELFAAQGFPADYRIGARLDGSPRPKYQQVARCGNSVSPMAARALVAANYSQTAINDSAVQSITVGMDR